MGQGLDVIPSTQPRSGSVKSFGLSAGVTVSRPKRAVRVFILSPFLLRVDLGENDRWWLCGCKDDDNVKRGSNSSAAPPWNQHPPPKSGKVDCGNRPKMRKTRCLVLVHHLTTQGPASRSAPSTRHTPRIGYMRAALQAGGPDGWMRVSHS